MRDQGEKFVFHPVRDFRLATRFVESARLIDHHKVAGEMRADDRELAQVLLEDPAVESVSSFIGVDGANITLNAGRVLIALKPLYGRTALSRGLIVALTTVPGVIMPAATAAPGGTSAKSTMPGR